MLLRCIDFETTGENKEDERHAVCEVGWQDLEVVFGDPIPGAVQAFMGGGTSMLCNPGRPMPPEARAVHHIGDAELADAPSPTEAFMRLMVGPPAYFVAHNADFENSFFGGGEVPFICTYKVALRVWPDAPGHGLQVLRYWLGLDIDPALGLPAHRAGPDAYVGAVLMARILEEPSAPTLETMARWSRGAALLPKITFGTKYKGQPWEEADTGYLRWIVDKSELDRNVKANARHHLKLRGAL